MMMKISAVVSFPVYLDNEQFSVNENPNTIVNALLNKAEYILETSSIKPTIQITHFDFTDSPVPDTNTIKYIQSCLYDICE